VVSKDLGPPALQGVAERDDLFDLVFNLDYSRDSDIRLPVSA
jgi:hypothetical protein